MVDWLDVAVVGASTAVGFGVLQSSDSLQMQGLVQLFHRTFSQL